MGKIFPIAPILACRFAVRLLPCCLVRARSGGAVPAPPGDEFNPAETS
jgi:hypothetical protein